MSPGWAETIWSIDVMAPGLVSEGFLINPLDFLTLVLNGILWDFTNIQATQGWNFLIFMIFLGITPLLDSLIRDMKEQWFSLY